MGYSSQSLGGTTGSLKNKLSQLEVSNEGVVSNLIIVQEMIRTVNEDIQFNKREVQMLRHEKQQLENVLSNKSIEVRKTLQIEAQR